MEKNAMMPIPFQRMAVAILAWLSPVIPATESITRLRTLMCAHFYAAMENWMMASSVMITTNTATTTVESPAQSKKGSDVAE